jgi:hypothetical protein
MTDGYVSERFEQLTEFPSPPYSPNVIGNWMLSAIRKIDGVFGEGYSRDHPELLGQFLISCSIDCASNELEHIARSIEDVEGPDLSGVAEAIQNIAAMIDLHGGSRG